jgi:hypothetical protein
VFCTIHGASLDTLARRLVSSESGNFVPRGDRALHTRPYRSKTSASLPVGRFCNVRQPESVVVEVARTFGGSRAPSFCAGEVPRAYERALLSSFSSDSPTVSSWPTGSPDRPTRGAAARNPVLGVLPPSGRLDEVGVGRRSPSRLQTLRPFANSAVKEPARCVKADRTSRHLRSRARPGKIQNWIGLSTTQRRILSMRPRLAPRKVGPLGPSNHRTDE